MVDVLDVGHHCLRLQLGRVQLLPDALTGLLTVVLLPKQSIVVLVDRQVLALTNGIQLLLVLVVAPLQLPLEGRIHYH